MASVLRCRSPCVNQREEEDGGGRREASSFHLLVLEPTVSNVETMLHVDGGYHIATEAGNGTQVAACIHASILGEWIPHGGQHAG